MKHHLTRAAAIGILGAALLAPSIASADPIISATSGGQPILSDGATGHIGDAITLTGTGCTIAGRPADAYMGLFTAQEGDPWVDAAWQPYQSQVDVSGGFSWDITIPEDNGRGTFGSRFYCSDGPVTDVHSETMLWVSPLVVMDIEDAPVANRTLAAKAGAMRTAAADTGDGSVSMTVDPDALPVVDRIGIPGPIAANLKMDVDEDKARIAQVQRMFRVFFGRSTDEDGLSYWLRHIGTDMTVKTAATNMAASPEFKRNYGTLDNESFVNRLYQNTLGRPADPAGLDYWTGQLRKGVTRASVGLAFAESDEFVRRSANANYVSAVYHEVAHRTPSAATITSLSNRLEAGELRVTVVEDVALTVKPAATWIANADS